MNKGNAQTVIIFFLSLILAAVLTGSGIYFWQQKKLEEVRRAVLPTPSPTVIPSATITPTVYPATDGPTIVISPAKPDEELIREAMAAKHSKTVAETTISISKKDASHAWGSVKFAGEIAGGWFLAAKTGGEWIIVQDGNGTISCELIAPYDFPVDMVPECVNSSGNLIRR